MNTNTAYTFNDVLIQPKYSEVLSRTHVKLTCRLGNHTFELPIISSNMKTVTEINMATTMAKYGGLGILHRFCSTSDNIFMYEKTQQKFKDEYIERQLKYKPMVGASIGVQEEDKNRFDHLYQSGARIFCIDVAHGHHILVKEMLKWINNQLFLWDRNARGKVTIIAGNIATPDAYYDLTEWGADAVKVGIGPSPVCHTRYATGVGYPQLSALENIYNQSRSHLSYPSIIADGGLKYVGDIAKALKFADMVMIGSMISGTTETPGNVYKDPSGTYYKIYGGSASGENKGENKFVEGVTTSVPFKGKLKYILKEIAEGLQSSCSYVGAYNLNQFKQKCEFAYISSGASKESKF